MSGDSPSHGRPSSSGLDEAPASRVLAELTRSVDLEHHSVPTVLREILERATRVLGVARANVWLYSADGAELGCIAHLDVRAPGQLFPAPLRAAQCPSYFAALEALRNVAVMDAFEDARTAELSEYLASYGISALVDVPILRAGRVRGVVCHEHVGERRVFNERERAFAGSIGDLVALTLETQERLQAIEEAQRLREQLVRLRTVESLGHLAVGVAHDFRNHLQVIRGSTELLKESYPQLAADINLESVELAVTQANDLCERLLVYAGRRAPKRQRVGPEALAHSLIKLLTPTLPPGVTLTLVGSAISEVEVDATEFNQLLMNLLRNAIDATARDTTASAAPARDNKIRVALRLVDQFESPTLDFRHRKGGPWLIIEVADTGCGMTEVQRDKMFDPFFTTKADGHGFGLATVLGIVRSHGGAIRVDTALARGTTITVAFPTEY